MTIHANAFETAHALIDPSFEKIVPVEVSFEHNDVFLRDYVEDDIHLTGWPQFILVNETECRWATHDEVTAILDLMIASDEDQEVEEEEDEMADGN